jgi:hypothetical protein
VHRKSKWKKPSELAEGCHDADQCFWISEMLRRDAEENRLQY